MAVRIEFALMGRPVAWARTGGNFGADGKGARRFTPHKQRAAMVAVAKAYKAQAVADRLNATMIFGPIKLEILAIYATPVSWSRDKREAAARGLVWKTSTPDWDNLGKLVSDALNGIAYSDDAQIAVSSVAKRYGSPERTVIRLSQLPSWEMAPADIGLPVPQGRLAL